MVDKRDPDLDRTIVLTAEELEKLDAVALTTVINEVTKALEQSADSGATSLKPNAGSSSPFDDDDLGLLEFDEDD